MIIKSKRVWFYKQEYMKKEIAKIKEEYKKVCLEDVKLDSGFKKFVSDANNITVKLNPIYGYALKADFWRVSVNYSFEYQSNYQAGTGKYKVTDITSSTIYVKEETENRSFRSTHEGEYSIHSTAKRPIRAVVGLAVDKCYKPENYFEVKNEEIEQIKEISQEFYDLIHKELREEDVAEYVTVGRFSDDIYTELKNGSIGIVYKGDVIDKTFRMSVSDFSIDEANIIYMPCTYEFSIEVKYEGKTHSRKNFKSIYEIYSFGPNTGNYNKYLLRMEENQEKYRQYQKKISMHYKINFALIFVLAVLLLTFKLTSRLFGLDYNYEEIPIVMLPLGSVSAFFMYIMWLTATNRHEKLDIRESFYRTNVSIEKLLSMLDNKFNKEMRRERSAAISFTIFIIMVFAIVYLVDIRYMIATYGSLNSISSIIF